MNRKKNEGQKALMKKLFLSILCIMSLAAAMPDQAAWYHWMRPSPCFRNPLSGFYASFSAWWNKDRSKIEALEKEIRILNQGIVDLTAINIAHEEKAIDIYKSIEKQANEPDQQFNEKKIPENEASLKFDSIIADNQLHIAAIREIVQKQSQDFESYFQES
jgi:hypothetical protein